jgi:hypothetical protein
VLSGSKKHSFAHTVKLVYVAGILTVDKDCRTRGGGGYFQFAGGVLGRQPSRFHQLDFDFVGLPRLQDDLLDQLVVPGLANDNFVLAGQEHKFLVTCKFFHKAYVLPVYPHSRSFSSLLCAANRNSDCNRSSAHNTLINKITTTGITLRLDICALQKTNNIFSDHLAQPLAVEH